MKRIVLLAVGLAVILSGCGTPVTPTTPLTISSVTPSLTGVPNSVVTLNNFEFVSIQGTGQIFTYNIASGTQVPVGSPFVTSCLNPSGMVIAAVSGVNVMAVVCYDTNSLLTLTVHADGSLTSLGSVSGLPTPYPGIVLDGTNVFVPLFGQSAVSNGSLARVSIASPAVPVITGTATLASPSPGAFANAGYLAVSNGYLYLMAGSENGPINTTSTIQVVDESTMSLVGTPFTVLHSPQQIAIQGTVAYVTFYDATQLESIDISTPSSLRPLGTASLAAAPTCHALSIAIRNSAAYVGCYAEGVLELFDVTDPTNMKLSQTLANIPAPQRLVLDGPYLLVPSSVSGGKVYQVPVTPAGISGGINAP